MEKTIAQLIAEAEGVVPPGYSPDEAAHFKSLAPILDAIEAAGYKLQIDRGGLMTFAYLAPRDMEITRSQEPPQNSA